MFIETSIIGSNLSYIQELSTQLKFISVSDLHQCHIGIIYVL